MVPVVPAGRLTRIGFRRDVRLFLAALVGFLIVLILALVMLLQRFALTTEESVRAEWSAAADLAAQTLDQTAPGGGEGALEGAISFVRGRYSLLAVELRRPGLPPLVSGTVPSRGAESVERPIAGGRAIFWFDAGRLDNLRRIFRWTAGIAIGATAAGALLLLLYVPHILKPIEEMLDHARSLGQPDEDVEESRYLIDTFKSSIATLKLQEAELKRLHEREKSRADDLERMTATLTRSLNSGFIALDHEGRLVDANRAAREILRIPPDEPLPGRPAAAALGNNAFTERLAEAFAQRLAVAREEIRMSLGGSELAIGLTTVPLFSEDDKFLGLLALFTDLTPIRSLEARLRAMQSLADLGEMSAGIAHEFRNSLSTILGYLKLARKQQIPGEVDGRIRSAEQEASLLAAAVEGLLAFARPMKVDRRTVDLRRLIDDLVARLGIETNGTEVRIEGERVTTDADPILLGRAFENLLRNASESIQAAGRRGVIAIHLSDRPSPRIAITDNGAGLDPAEASRFFLPFQSTKASGMGLGLALTRKIVLLHGGSIELTGTPGEGATAIIELPE